MSLRPARPSDVVFTNNTLNAATTLLDVLEVGVSSKKSVSTPKGRMPLLRGDVQKTRDSIYSDVSQPASPMTPFAVSSNQIYGNAEKIGIRAAFAAAARCGPLVYLDDTGVDVNASATAYFLRNGYNIDELHPVNFNAMQCLALSSSFEVDCINMDMAVYLKTLPVQSVGGVWIDLMGYRVSHELVVAAMISSKSVVTLTFTSGHAPSSSVDNRSSSAPFTDQYARIVLNNIKSLRIDEGGRRVGDDWQCTSLQVYGAATRKRELNMINLQFQRKDVLGQELCTFDTSRHSEKRSGRIITSVVHDGLYEAFVRKHVISKKTWETVLSDIVVGARLGVFFEKTQLTAEGWYVGSVNSIPTSRVSVDEWVLQINIYFEGEGSFKISLHSADYLTTPHKPGRSWVLLES